MYNFEKNELSLLNKILSTILSTTLSTNKNGSYIFFERAQK